MHVTFDHSRPETDNITTYFFEPEKPVDYVAGQFIELYIPHDNPDDRGIKRWFTLSSAPSDKLLSITTKHAKRSSTFKQALAALEPGTRLKMAEPMGDFVLPRDASRPLVFIAGGIGVTPFHSMLQQLAADKEHRQIRMLYGVPTENEIIFQDTFDAANQHVTVMVENPSPEWGGERGTITVDEIIGLEEPSDDSLIYVSGPEPMVESLTKQLIARGFGQQQVVSDYFPNYPTI
ncbi:MAG: hypothetical protein JWM37_780 [Candidatus Saccharibacteria bacterium]|nr:hypothetical protein [Candidatus Saccharibacteria bacterium]